MYSLWIFYIRSCNVIHHSIDQVRADWTGKNVLNLVWTKGGKSVDELAGNITPIFLSKFGIEILPTIRSRFWIVLCVIEKRIPLVCDKNCRVWMCRLDLLGINIDVQIQVTVLLRRPLSKRSKQSEGKNLWSFSTHLLYDSLDCAGAILRACLRRKCISPCLLGGLFHT